MKVAVYPGSFDPITNGHINLIERGLLIFDKLIVAVATNIKKKPLFEAEERIEMIKKAVPSSRIEVDTFQGLLVDYAKQKNARIILRGLRALSDFEFEFQIGLANMDMAPRIETVFLLTEPKNIFVSSSLVKEIAQNGGDVSRYVPEPALGPLMAQLQGR